MRLTRRAMRRSRRLLLTACLLAMAAPDCVRGEHCEGPGDRIDATSDRPAGELPSWAVGSFGRHDGDIFNYLILEDGTAYSALDGGDYGGCGQAWAVFANGRLHIVSDPQDLTPLHTVIVRTTDGRFFETSSDNNDLTCDWDELEPTNLCGKKVGGCGGYGGSEPCPWEEVGGKSGCEDPPGE